MVFISFRILIINSYKDGTCSVDLINCSLVIPINREMQSDGVSDVYDES